MKKCPKCGAENFKLPLDPNGAYACNSCFEIIYDPRNKIVTNFLDESKSKK